MRITKSLLLFGALICFLTFAKQFILAQGSADCKEVLVNYGLNISNYDYYLDEFVNSLDCVQAHFPSPSVTPTPEPFVMITNNDASNVNCNQRCYDLGMFEIGEPFTCSDVGLDLVASDNHYWDYDSGICNDQGFASCNDIMFPQGDATNSCGLNFLPPFSPLRPMWTYCRCEYYGAQ